jgi:hypothetical protein
VTEEKWLAENHNPELLLLGFPAKEDRRKFQLLGCEFLRRGFQFLDMPSRECTELVERVAEGQASERAAHECLERMDVGRGRGNLVDFDSRKVIGYLVRLVNPPLALMELASEVADAVGAFAGGWVHYHRERLTDEQGKERFVTAKFAEKRTQTTLIRCVFGNPFRPVAFDPRWRTEDVRGLARGIFEDRAFDRLPLLADALMDAGCDDEQLLNHCRSEGPHVRGCWVVDLVLGKE